jgi:hypothetical protein
VLSTVSRRATSTFDAKRPLPSYSWRNIPEPAGPGEELRT